MSELLARRRSLRVETAPRPATQVKSDPPRSPLSNGLVIRRDNVATFFGLATQLHLEGHTDEARDLYLQILSADQKHADAWHQLGVLEHQADKPLVALNHLRHAIALNATDGNYFVNLGDVFRSLGRFPEAIMVFEHALMMNPADSDAVCGIGHCHLQQGNHGAATDAYRRTTELAPTSSDAFTYFGVALRHDGRTDEAIAAFRRALELDPDHDEANHLLAAATGDATDRAPRQYVRDLFDGYAATFDSHLVDKLRYDIPRVARETLAAHVTPPAHGWRIADLGCGTGLCGEAVAPWARHLVGVDLSPRMITRARQRDIYDELRLGDIVDDFRGSDEPFDLVLAGDVFIYLGDLTKMMTQCGRALRDGGWLCFSTEESTEGNVALRPTGRYAHADQYVRDCGATGGLSVVDAKTIPVRHEGGQAIPGRLYLMQRGERV